MLRHAVFAATAIGLLWRPTAAAQSDPADGHQTVVRGQQPTRNTAADDPAAVTTVVDLGDSAMAADLAAALQQVPGLLVRDYGGGQQQMLSIRGSRANQVAVFLDGVRLDGPAGLPVDLSLFEISQLSEAEVRRSAGSTRLGSGALGGALLLRTPRLRHRQATSASASYGSFNSFGLQFRRAARTERLRYLVGGAFRRSDGDFVYQYNDESLSRQNNDSRIGQLLLKLDDPSLSRWHLQLIDSLAIAERGAPGPSRSPNARQADLRNVLGIRATRYDPLFRSSRLTLGADYRYRHFSFEQPQTTPESVSHSHGVSGNALLALPLAGVGRLDIGAELRGEFLIGTDAGRQRQFSLGAFAAEQIQLFDRRLILIPALRLAVASDYAAAIVPKLGIVAQPLHRSGEAQASSWREIQIIGNVGRSYRYPSFEERFIRVEGAIGNPYLLPEDALVADIGLRWRTRRLSSSLVYFRRWLKNTILFAPISAFALSSDNYSRVRAHGLEGEFSARPGLCLSANAAYTFTATRFSRPAFSLPGQPRHLVAARIGWAAEDCARPPSMRWLHGVGLWVRGLAQGPMVLMRFDAQPEEGRLMLAAGARFRYRWLMLSAEGRNLLDKRDARDAIGYPLPPASFWLALSATR